MTYLGYSTPVSCTFMQCGDRWCSSCPQPSIWPQIAHGTVASMEPFDSRGFPSAPIRPQLLTYQFAGYLQEQLLYATLDSGNQSATNKCEKHWWVIDDWLSNLWLLQRIDKNNTWETQHRTPVCTHSLVSFWFTHLSVTATNTNLQVGYKHTCSVHTTLRLICDE